MILALAIAASIASCSIENAQYVLRGAPGVTARFYNVQTSSDWPSGLALDVHVARSGRSYWFLPWQGGTDQKTNLAWVREANSPFVGQAIRREIEMFATDASYDLRPDILKARDVAPAHLLLPDVGHLAWYSTTAAERDSLPRAFFDLSECRVPNRSEKAPQIEFPAIP
jgi:hypothetical protein